MPLIYETPSASANAGLKSSLTIAATIHERPKNRKMDLDMSLLSTIPGLPEKERSKIRHAKAQATLHDRYLSEEEALSSTDDGRSTIDGDEDFTVADDDDDDLLFMDAEEIVHIAETIDYTCVKPTLVEIRKQAPQAKSRSASRLGVDRPSRTPSKRSISSTQRATRASHRHSWVVKPSSINKNRMSVVASEHPPPRSQTPSSERPSTPKPPPSTPRTSSSADGPPTTLPSSANSSPSRSPLGSLARTLTLGKRKARPARTGRRGRGEPWGARMAELLDTVTAGTIQR
ncbi:MAG: hypothetical protein M1833_004636 [Piccolia ochrophora]|nr:MAG: hypothetical protein M1833_004636 [Piccolia ochrophora]